MKNIKDIMGTHSVEDVNSLAKELWNELFLCRDTFERVDSLRKVDDGNILWKVNNMLTKEINDLYASGSNTDIKNAEMLLLFLDDVKEVMEERNLFS